MVNSSSFRPMYEKMGISLDKSGRIMLDVDGSSIPAFPNPEGLYVTKHPDRFWIKGFVAGKTPHVTVLYGLMETGLKWKDQVDEVLGEVRSQLNAIEIDHVGFFPSPFPDEPYYCIIAHVRITPELLEARQRLEFLPHINIFPDFKAHITIAYIKKDELLRTSTIDFYNRRLKGAKMNVVALNYGGNKDK